MVNNTTEVTEYLKVNVLGGLLLAFVVQGLTAFIWAFSCHCRLRVFKESIILFFSCQHDSLRGAQNIHNCLIALLLVDALMATTTVLLAIEFFVSTCNPAFTCVSVFNVFTVWSLSRCFGVVLHLLSVLVSILFLCHPEWAAKLCWVVTVVPLLISVFVPVYIYIGQVVILGLGVIIFGLAVAIVVQCRVPTASPITSDKKIEFVYTAMYTLFSVYVPIFVLQCLMISSDNFGEPANKYFSVYVVILTGTNFQLFVDGRLCCFMLKLPAGDEEEEEEQQQQDLENPHYNVSVNALNL